MSIENDLPLPLVHPPLPSSPPEVEEKRLWIGNIDSRLTEYSLLKIVQQFGAIKKFDFLFHKMGPLKGQPRGYCFVTYERREEAEKAIRSLNGTLSMGKTLVVKWAFPSDSATRNKTEETCKQVDETKKTINANHQIMAIEAKLKAMKAQKDLEVNLSSAPVTENCSFALNKKHPTYRKHRSIPYHRTDLSKR